jgi:hypothetical protein
MKQAPRAPQEFAILTPEAKRERATALLTQALAEIRGMIGACLSGVPETGGRLAKPVRVGGRVFHIPLNPNAAAIRSLNEALQTVFGSWPHDGLRRSEVEDAAIGRHPELFAALFAWGYLHPEEEWGDAILWEREPSGTCREVDKRDALRVFAGFAHGEQESGIPFQSGDRRLYFDSAYQGRVARVMTDCMEAAPRELCRLSRMAIVGELFQTYPQLERLFPDARTVVEAMVEIIQKGGSAA